MSANDDSRPQTNQTARKDEEDAKKRRIRALNTRLRKKLKGGRITSTSGFYHLGGPLRERFFQALSDFNDFNPDNDPYDEHDFGKISIFPKSCSSYGSLSGLKSLKSDNA